LRGEVALWEEGARAECRGGLHRAHGSEHWGGGWGAAPHPLDDGGLVESESGRRCGRWELEGGRLELHGTILGYREGEDGLLGRGAERRDRRGVAEGCCGVGEGRKWSRVAATWG